MRDNSIICDFIYQMRDSPDIWKGVIEGKGIKIKQEENFAIFNYGVECDFNDPTVREARGIIIDLDNYHVVCRGFDKFFNVQESYAAAIDWDTAVVQEKIDGSIIKCWWYDDDWHWSTNSCINAENANCTTGGNFLELIKKADNYGKIMYELGQDERYIDFTWIFELVSPYNKIVIKYPRTVLYQIGCRNNVTGEESYWPLIDEEPKLYKLKTLNECLAAVTELNKSDNVTNEGFVVVDKYWNRVKIKSPEYLYFHRVVQNHSFKKEYIIDLILNTSYEQIREIAEQFEDLRLRIKYYDFAIEQFKCTLANFLYLCRNVATEYDGDKKAIALAIKDNPLSGYGFTMLNKGKSVDDILNNLTIKDYCKFIKDYNEELTYDIILHGRTSR